MILTDLNCVAANTIQVFPMSLIRLLQPLLACESPRSLLLPAVHISGTCKTTYDGPLRRQGLPAVTPCRAYFHLAVVDQNGNLVYHAWPVCFSGLAYHSLLSFFSTTKHKHTSAGRKGGRPPRLVSLPIATNKEVFVKNLLAIAADDQLDLISEWLKGVRDAASERGLAFQANMMCQHIAPSLPFLWVGFSYTILWTDL